MIALAHTLPYYKRPDVQERILEGAAGREVWIKYGERPGRRPDVLLHGRDVFEAARQGATSFHVSVERWHNPLEIEGISVPGELAELRAGWDLVIDVDCEYWEIAKQITHLFAHILEEEGVCSFGVKFSGNKGFHIIVPFEAFPPAYKGKPMERWYPEVPRRVLKYLHERLKKLFREKVSDTILGSTGLSLADIYVQRCIACGAQSSIREGASEFLCPHCETREQAEVASSVKPCPKCAYPFMKNMGQARDLVCRKCSGRQFETVTDLSKIIKLDEGLVVSKHMIRGAYSLHEKSGLVSLPIPRDAILSFEREQAAIASLPAELPPFMPGSAGPGEASRLFEHAMDYTLVTDMLLPARQAPQSDFDAPTMAIDEQHFPPCIRLTLEGVKDGKKRAAFYLINFLSSVGWSHEQIEKRLDEWNEKNSPPLRRGFLQSQVRSHKGKRMLPPNCDNEAYYRDLGVCQPDSLCQTIRNPANYSIKRARRVERETKKA